jgi:D-threo-aldose 1-dehydrogenase
MSSATTRSIGTDSISFGPALRSCRLGTSDVFVTELGFGGAPVGGLYAATSDRVARDAIDSAWDGGIRYFDTAPHYGLGLSELRLGAALRDRPREDFVISTKVGRLLAPNTHPQGSDIGYGFDVPDDLQRVDDYSRDGIQRSLEASLKRLQLDRVDIVLVHDPDAFVEQSLREALPTLIELRDQKVVGAIGVGMNQWEALRRFVLEADLDVVMVAGCWTLLDRSASPLLEACSERGVSVLAAAPFNSGILATARPGDGTPYNYVAAPRHTVAAARRLAGICERYGTRLPAAALQFPLRHESVAAVVTGMRSSNEVDEDVDLFMRTIPEDAWAELDQTWAGNP